LSQLGWQWIFLAAPVAAVAHDLWRYAFGRLGDPPRPAGVLPGAELSGAEPAGAGAPGLPAPRPLPLVYRRTQETRGARGAWRRSETARTSPS
ncbi:MAG TPA: hypothetical protein VH257_11380, partial [Chloroflexota bacterium]|nr:hypothetical protein [Chloroflexota bacterium]